tara:strand:- start:244 stop:441 length:198 start_codon:yes stop_codon:yes gene_type:complete
MKSDNEIEVPETTLRSWRSTGLIGNEEIAFKMGDLYIAENVVTRNRRVIKPSISESSANKRILKG